MGGMQKLFAVIGLCAVCGVLGAVGGAWLLHQRASPPPPDPPAVVEQMREVARLETLHLELHKKISFEPAPEPLAESGWRQVADFVRSTIHNPQGRAIVFAQVDLGLDLQKLRPENLRVEGRRIEVVLPPLEAQVELLPGETEIIGSNLDSAETAQLFDKARNAFRSEVMMSPKLQEQARGASERALRALLITLGYREVVFVDKPASLKAG